MHEFKDYEQYLRSVTDSQLNSFYQVFFLFKLITWALGMGSMAVAFFNPSIFVIIPCAFLTWFAAVSDSNLDLIKKLVKKEQQRRLSS